MDSSAYAYSPSSANVVEFPRHTASEDRAPYDAAPRFDPGFMILPAQFKDVPPTVNIGDGKKPVSNGDMRAVYSELAAYTGTSNVVFPSVATIAQRLGYGESHVKRVIKALIQCALISKQRRFEGGMNQSNAYTLTHHKTPNDRSVATHPTSVAQTPMVGRHAPDGRSPRTQEEEPTEPDRERDPFPNADEAIMPRLMREAICEARGITSLSAPMKKQIDGIVASLIDMGANNFDIPNVLFWAQHHDFWGDAHGTKVSKGYSLKQLPTIFEQWVGAGRPRRRISVFAGAPAPEAR